MILVRRVFLALASGGLLYTAAWAGSTFFPSTVYAVQEREIQVESPAPIMARIAMCESHNSHLCTKELADIKLCNKGEVGQVLLNPNKNDTVDIGKYQINETYWGAKATELGLNLFDEKDNEKMAYWIYKNRGTTDWSASQRCWNK